MYELQFNTEDHDYQYIKIHRLVIVKLKTFFRNKLIVLI